MAAGNRRGLTAFALGWGAGLMAVAVTLVDPGGLAGMIRERGLDLLVPLTAPDGAVPDPPVVVVEIDRRSLAAIGPWPWPRDRLAALLEAIGAGLPRAVVLDILLEGPDRAAPRSLAIMLARESARPDLAEAVASLPDPDERLAVAMTAAPTVLAAILADAGGDALPGAPLILGGRAPGLSPWIAGGLLLPHGPFLDAGTDLGVASLAPGPDGRVREVPMLAVAGETVVAGLALEVLRLSAAAGAYLVSPEADRLSVGGHSVPLTKTASLRLRPAAPDRVDRRTISAVDLVTGSVDLARLEGRIVLVGGGAPELGGLWPTPAAALAPSVQIQADAVETVLSGRVPWRPDGARAAEAVVGSGLAAIAAAAGAFGSPALAVAVVLALPALLAAGSALAALAGGILLDPLLPAFVVFIGGLVAGVAGWHRTRRDAAAVRRRFERHLAPAVVDRIVADPSLARLAGERRTVTALFTDIEDFTALADRLDPADLVALLDRYISVVTAAVTRHGGMVDKVVGDAVHALFNAPLDLDGHADRAVAAARDILAETQALRRNVAPVDLGRTRIGVETGDAVVGDVGAGDKLDYTAHGPAVNTAARLEALNKKLGTSILIGPGAAAAIRETSLAEVGLQDVRGRGHLLVFTLKDDVPSIDSSSC